MKNTETQNTRFQSTEARSTEAGLQGLPDFGKSLHTRFGKVYGAYQRSGYRIPPYKIGLRTTDTGSTSIRLSLVRGELPFMAPEPYGVLGLKMRAYYASAETLQAFRVEMPDMVLQEIRPVNGFIRLITMPDITPDHPRIPVEARQAKAVSWDGENGLRLTIRTSIESAEMLEQMILQDILAARIFAEFELSGVCQRHAYSVDFDAGAFLDSVRGRLNAQDSIDLDVLGDLFVAKSADFVFRNHNGQGVQLQGAALKPVIQTLMDRFIRRFAKYVARDDTAGAAQIAIFGNDTARPQNNRVHWDLSQPTRVSRLLTLQSPGLNQLGVSLEQRQKLIERTVLPAMRAGTRSIQVYANLAGRPAGLFSMGAHISVPPAPPDRPQKILRSLEFDELEFQGSTNLPLAVSERLHYHYQGFISIQSDAGLINFTGAVSEQTADEILVLSADAFGARCVSVTASKALTGLAVVHGQLGFEQSSLQHNIRFVLDQVQTSTTLVMPGDDDLAALEMRIEPLGDGVEIVLNTNAAESLHIDLPIFREYGPHAVELQCLLPPENSYCEVQYVEENRIDDHFAYQSLVFFQDSPGQSCHWFAENPFTPGLCYRVSVDGATPGEWSAPDRRFLNLILDIKLIETGSGSNGMVSVTASGGI